MRTSQGVLGTFTKTCTTFAKRDRNRAPTVSGVWQNFTTRWTHVKATRLGVTAALGTRVCICMPVESRSWSCLVCVRDWYLTHWGRVTHIFVGNLSIIGSDNGLSPGWRQAINCTNAGILLIGRLVTNFSEILIQLLAFFIQENVFWKCRLRNSGYFVLASMC